MAKVDNPPFGRFGRKQQDMNVHELSLPVSDLDLRGIRDKAVEDADHAKSSFAGKASAKSKAPKVRAKHDEVLRLMRLIRGKNPTLGPDDLANKIQSRLPPDMCLGPSQIIKIMRASKKQSTG
jgi:hypothetical protein